MNERDSFASSRIRKASLYRTEEPTMDSWTITPAILSLSKNCTIVILVSYDITIAGISTRKASKNTFVSSLPDRYRIRN